MWKSKRKMANKEELKNMILQFKVSDLQLLLGFAGQNKNGRKTELQRKATHLIQNKLSIPLEMKIRQMFRDLIPEVPSQRNTNNGYSFPGYSDRYNSDYYLNGYSSHSSQHAMPPYSSYMPDYYGSTSTNSGYYGGGMEKTNYLYNAPPREEPPTYKQDFTTIEPFTRIPNEQRLSLVSFKKLPFFKFKSNILLCTPLIPKVKRTDSYESTFVFSLNADQLSYLNWAKKNDKEFRYQVQLRMCILSENGETEMNDDLPLALLAKVNDKSCQLPPAIPSTNKQGMLLKRMNAPINLTHQTSKKLSSNTLLINWSVTADKLYGIRICLVKKYTSDELINRLKEKGERDKKVTEKYVKQKLSETDDDDDIAATSLKVSLICPLGKILISLPVRATTCKHLQCFDGSLYIRMNDVKSVWQCPVCNQPCFYEDLFIDGYFADVLRSGGLTSKTTEIQIEDDGHWIPVEERKRKNSETSAENESKRCKSDSRTIGDLTTSVGETSVTSCKHNNTPFSSFSSNELNDSFNFYECTLSKVEADRQTPPSTCNDDDSESRNKKVILVDLTSSDTEVEDEDYIPLNLKVSTPSIGEGYSSVPPWLKHSVDKNLPPVYDID